MQCEFCGKQYIQKFPACVYFGNNCYDCSYWLQKIYLPEAEKKNRAIIDGTYWIIAPEILSPFMGMGGTEFCLRFRDGREITTYNLWYQGEIPENFREFLPDNAEIIPVKWDIPLP